MKKLIVLASVLIVSASILSGCLVAPTSSSNKSSSKDTATISSENSTPESKDEPSSEVPAEPEPKSADQGEVGDCNIAIKDFALLKDYKDNDAIVINFDYTNNDEEATAFMFACSVTAYQDGVELETAVVTGDGYDSEASTKKIKAGVTLAVQRAYVLTNKTSPVEVEVAELFSLSDKDTQLIKTFDIAK